MCHAVPAEVVTLLDAQTAKVKLGGVAKTVSIALTPNARPGDYVVVHAGFALATIDHDQAQRTLALMTAAAHLTEGPAA